MKIHSWRCSFSMINGELKLYLRIFKGPQYLKAKFSNHFLAHQKKLSSHDIPIIHNHCNKHLIFSQKVQKIRLDQIIMTAIFKILRFVHQSLFNLDNNGCISCPKLSYLLYQIKFNILSEVFVESGLEISKFSPTHPSFSKFLTITLSFLNSFPLPSKYQQLL